MAPKNKENSSSGNKRKRQISEEEDDEDYRRRRDRNNQVNQYLISSLKVKCVYLFDLLILIFVTGCETVKS